MSTGLAVLLGPAAALGSAAAWALGSILFRQIGDEASPLGMTLGKGLLSLVLLGGLLLVAGSSSMTTQTALILAASGIIGITLGDVFFFMALVRLDPRLTLLLMTVGQVITVIMAIAFLGERPSTATWVGIPLVLAGVTWVMWERDPSTGETMGRLKAAGVGWGLLAALLISTGFILAKAGLDEVSALQGTVVRFAAGMAGLALFGLARGEVVTWLRPFASRRLLRSMVLAVLVMSIGGFYLTMVAFKYTDASVATILMSTEPIFVLPLAAFFLKERISRRAVFGALVAVGGVLLIVNGRLQGL